MKPREKILKYWPNKLEGSELVATILWTWIKWLDVHKLAKIVNKMIEEKGENIKIDDLVSIKWIWKIKAIAIISAFELAKRYFIKENVVIKSSLDILEQVKEYRDRKQEYLICLTLDWANRLINNRIITIWLLNQSLVHPREVFADAIADRANSIVLVHNHPSGSNNPSNEDIVVTNRLKDTSEILWIKILDHIIITKDNYFSFNENNLI